MTFNWATTLWAACVLLYILQLWWVGWELRIVSDWAIIDFFTLVVGSIFVCGAAELALPLSDYAISDNAELDFLAHSQSLGRVSALSMLGYFCVGPYVNLTMFGTALLPSIGFPILGVTLMLLTVLIEPVTPAFGGQFSARQSSTISLPVLPPVNNKLIPSIALSNPLSLWARYLILPSIRYAASFSVIAGTLSQ